MGSFFITLHYLFHYILLFDLAKDPDSIAVTQTTGISTSVGNNDVLLTAPASHALHSEVSTKSSKVTATTTHDFCSEASTKSSKVTATAMHALHLKHQLTHPT